MEMPTIIQKGYKLKFYLKVRLIVFYFMSRRNLMFEMKIQIYCWL